MTLLAGSLTFASSIACIQAGTLTLPPLSGGISFGGSHTVDTGDVNTATSFTAFPFVFSPSASDDFVTSTAISQVAFEIDVMPFVPIPNFWSYADPNDSSVTYAFDLMMLSPADRTQPNALSLSGSGIIRATGFDPTPSTWIFTANQAGQTFAFSASNSVAPVPEPSTSIISGLGLLALALRRRR